MPSRDCSASKLAPWAWAATALIALSLSGCGRSSPTSPHATPASTPPEPPTASVDPAQPSPSVADNGSQPDTYENSYPSYDDDGEPSDAEIQADIDAKVDAQIAEACRADPSGPIC